MNLIFGATGSALHSNQVLDGSHSYRNPKQFHLPGVVPQRFERFSSGRFSQQVNLAYVGAESEIEARAECPSVPAERQVLIRTPQMRVKRSQRWRQYRQVVRITRIVDVDVTSDGVR